MSCFHKGVGGSPPVSTYIVVTGSLIAAFELWQFSEATGFMKLGRLFCCYAQKTSCHGARHITTPGHFIKTKYTEKSSDMKFDSFNDLFCTDKHLHRMRM